MKTDPDLTRRLALAASELRAQLPPAPLLAAIHRRLDRAHWKKPAWFGRWFPGLGWAGLSTATAAVAALFVVRAMVAGDANVQPVDATDGFVRLVSADAWDRAQSGIGRTWVVSTEMPRSRLAALGLPYDPARAGERVPAELLLHSSGEVLAVRVSR